jgi:hypothetical protein
VRSSTLLDPMMRTSFASTSTRWASARTQEDGKQTGRGQAHIPASHALTGQLLRLQWLMARPQPP